MTLSTRCLPGGGPSQSSDGSITSKNSNRISNVTSQGSIPREKEQGRQEYGVSRPSSVIRAQIQPSPLTTSPSPQVVPVDNRTIFSENDSPMIVEPQVLYEKQKDGHPPPRKKLRDLFPTIGQPFDIYAAFPGHNMVLVEASDDED